MTVMKNDAVGRIDIYRNAEDLQNFFNLMNGNLSKI